MNSERNPKVSVIIPLYNSEKFIKDTIESVIEQTYKNIEIICVDDGSTDNTRKVIKDQFPQVKYLYQKNKGPAAARNLGLNHSTSDYVAFLDHDDIWHPEKIERQVSVFNSDQAVGLVYTNGVYLYNENNWEGGIFLPESFRELNDPKELLITCYIKSLSSVMVRRGVFEVVGLFDEKLTGCDDHDMWLKIIENFKIEYIDEPLMKYRIHENQFSKYNVKMWQGDFIILKNACQRYHYPLTARIKRVATIYYRLGECSWVGGNYVYAIKSFFLAGILDPVRSAKLIMQRVFSRFNKKK